MRRLRRIQVKICREGDGKEHFKPRKGEIDTKTEMKYIATE